MWDDNSVDEVSFNHYLEHIGQQSRVFLGVMKELYRIGENGAVIEVNVPHPRHENFLMTRHMYELFHPVCFRSSTGTE